MLYLAQFFLRGLEKDPGFGSSIIHAFHKIRQLRRRTRMTRVVSAVALFLCLSACQSTTSSSRDPLAGAWELVSGHAMSPDGKVTDYTGAKAKKVLADGHFAFLTVTTAGTVAAGSGTYSISGNTYTETVTNTAGRPATGTYTFTWRVEGDNWYHAGTSPNGTKYEEVWRRARSGA